MTWYLTMPELASTVGYQGWVRLSGYFGNRVTQRQDVRVLRRGFFSSSGGETGRGVRGVTVVDIEGSVCLRRREDAAAKTLRINSFTPVTSQPGTTGSRHTCTIFAKGLHAAQCGCACSGRFHKVECWQIPKGRSEPFTVRDEPRSFVIKSVGKRLLRI